MAQHEEPIRRSDGSIDSAIYLERGNVARSAVLHRWLGETLRRARRMTLLCAGGLVRERDRRQR